MVLDRFQSPSDWRGEPSSKDYTLGGDLYSASGFPASEETVGRYTSKWLRFLYTWRLHKRDLPERRFEANLRLGDFEFTRIGFPSLAAYGTAAKLNAPALRHYIDAL